MDPETALRVLLLLIGLLCGVVLGLLAFAKASLVSLRSSAVSGVILIDREKYLLTKAEGT